YKEEIFTLQKKSESIKVKTRDEDYFLNKFKTADRYYIDKYLESLTFLESDLKRLQGALQNDPNDEWSKKRMKFLNEGTNRLRFYEQNQKLVQNVQEVEEVQQASIEINTEDLKRILARIEEIQIGPYLSGQNPPQMIIKNFELIKKSLKENEETYLLNLQ